MEPLQSLGLVKVTFLAICIATLSIGSVSPAYGAPSGNSAVASSSGAISLPSKFYPGIAEEQSMRAHDALRAFYTGNLPKAHRILRALDTIEDAGTLPPLSRLLLTAMNGLYLQRDDAGSPEEAARLRSALDSAADKGIRKCAEPSMRPYAPTCNLIGGGIRGFRAILKLNTRSPGDVLREGLDAVALLEKSLALDSTVRDAHLGLGIFHVMAASSSPRVVRAMLRAAGRGVSMEEGLEHLRRSGYEGQYTSVASQYYLIRFLLPYDLELRREKMEIFRSVRETFPLSGLNLFLQGHEMLAFYPDSFYRPRARAALARRLRAIEPKDYAGYRYLNLVKYQYTLLDPKPPQDLAPDTTFALGGYGFYPEYIEALRLRHEISEAGPEDPQRADRIKKLQAMRKKLLARIRKADLSTPNQGLYLWHVGDALRADLLNDQDDSAVTTSKETGKSRKPPDK
jgi:hypothetical protein